MGKGSVFVQFGVTDRLLYVAHHHKIFVYQFPNRNGPVLQGSLQTGIPFKSMVLPDEKGISTFALIAPNRLYICQDHKNTVIDFDISQGFFMPPARAAANMQSGLMALPKGFNRVNVFNGLPPAKAAVVVGTAVNNGMQQGVIVGQAMPPQQGQPMGQPMGQPQMGQPLNPIAAGFANLQNALDKAANNANAMAQGTYVPNNGRPVGQPMQQQPPMQQQQQMRPPTAPMTTATQRSPMDSRASFSSNASSVVPEKLNFIKPIVLRGTHSASANYKDEFATTTSALMDWFSVVKEKESVLRDWLRGKGDSTSTIQTRIGLLSAIAEKEQLSLQTMFDACAPAFPYCDPLFVNRFYSAKNKGKNILLNDAVLMEELQVICLTGNDGYLYFYSLLEVYPPFQGCDQKEMFAMNSLMQSQGQLAIFGSTKTSKMKRYQLQK